MSHPSGAVAPSPGAAPVVVLGARTVGLGVARVLAPHGVPVTMVGDDRALDFAGRSRHVTCYVEGPHPEREEQAFVEFVSARVARLGRAMLVPTSDESLVAVSRHAATFEHAVVASPDSSATARCVDKRRTYELAAAWGVAAPRTHRAQSEADVSAAAQSLGLPCLVKPTHSHRYVERLGRKMTPVTSRASLMRAYHEARDLGLEVLIQEIIPGPDDHVMNYVAYAHRGEPLIEFTAHQLRSAPPWWGSPRVVRSSSVPGVLAPGRRMLRALALSGQVCIEFKVDPRDGDLKLIEVNARHNLSTLLAARCGVEFPWVEYQHRMYGAEPAPAEVRTGVSWIDLARDVPYSLLNVGREGLDVRDYLAPYRGPRVFAIWDRHDVGPFLARLATMARSGRSRGVVRPVGGAHHPRATSPPRGVEAAEATAGDVCP